MKKNNGITLIALIITIIVMLILVAVSVSILINSGLIGKAKEAGSKTKSAYEEESRTGDNLNIDGTTYNNIDEYIDSMDKVPVTDVYATVCNNGVLVFSNNVEDINSYMAENNTEVAEYYEIQNIVDNEYTYEYPIWTGNSNITTVKILNNIAPKTTTHWFDGLWNLISIDGLEKINTSNVTDMSYMFYNCDSLTSLNLSNFDTRNVTDMQYMFSDSYNLAILNLTSFNTSNVTDMESMFSDCNNLAILNLTSFNTSKVTDMSFMFQNCTGLTSLDLSSFDTSNVTNMQCMFSGTDDYFMGLTSINLSSFNTSNVTNMNGMFSQCNNLRELDLSSFDTSKVTDINGMFGYCTQLETIYVSNSFVTDNVTTSYSMFYNCGKLTGGNGTTYDSNHKDKEYARVDAPGTPGYFTLKSN